jgi:hypothetical protein
MLSFSLSLVLWVKTLSTQSFISPLDECALNNIEWNVVRWIGFENCYFIEIEQVSSYHHHHRRFFFFCRLCLDIFFIKSNLFCKVTIFLSINISATSTAKFVFLLVWNNFQFFFFHFISFLYVACANIRALLPFIFHFYRHSLPSWFDYDVLWTRLKSSIELSLWGSSVQLCPYWNEQSK